MSLPILGQNTAPKVDGREIRVLYCMVCDTLEELEPFNGRPENDTLLEVLVSRHEFPSGERHVGRLLQFPAVYWENQNIRKEIIRQIKGASAQGIDDFQPGFYDSRDTFREDAMKCFQAHLRPEGACPDYNSEKKMLVPDTKAERRDVGLPDPRKAPGPKRYLCSFCPVQSFYEGKYNQLKENKK